MEEEVKKKRRRRKKKEAEDPNKLHGNSHVVPIKEIPKDGTIQKRSEYLYDRKLHPLLVESMIMNGFTYTQICDKLGIPSSRAVPNKFNSISRFLRRNSFGL